MQAGQNWHDVAVPRLLCNNSSKGVLNKGVLRAAARLVLRLPKWASVSKAMRKKLHWLPYPERVEFKLCSTIYKCLHNSAPQYLIELCIPVATLPGRCHLRSAAYGDLFVPATSTKTIGPRGFFYAGPVA